MILYVTEPGNKHRCPGFCIFAPVLSIENNKQRRVTGYIWLALNCSKTSKRVYRDVMAGRVLALPQRSALLDAFVQITQNQRAHPYVSASYASCQLCVNWRVVFPHCTLYIMFYGVLSPLLSSMSDGGRNSHLSPHSTGKPQKTIVGCWRSLNIDPDSFGLHLGGKKSAAGKHKIQLFSD